MFILTVVLEQAEDNRRLSGKELKMNQAANTCIWVSGETWILGSVIAVKLSRKKKFWQNFYLLKMKRQGISPQLA